MMSGAEASHGLLAVDAGEDAILLPRAEDELVLKPDETYERQASPPVHHCRSGLIVAISVAIVVAAFALSSAAAMIVGFGAHSTKGPAAIRQLMDESLLSRHALHDVVAENLMRVAGGRIREEDRLMVVASVAKGFRDISLHLRQHSPQAAVALDSVHLSAGEQEALLGAMRLIGDPRIGALGLEIRRVSEQKEQQFSLNMKISDTVESLRTKFRPVLSWFRRAPSSGAQADLWASQLNVVGLRPKPGRDESFHGNISHSSHAVSATGDSASFDHMTAVLVRRRLMARVWSTPSLEIAPPRDLREPTPQPSLLKAPTTAPAWSLAAPVRDLRRPTPPPPEEVLGPSAPLRDIREPTLAPSLVTVMLDKVQSADEFRQPSQAPLRDIRETTPALAGPLAQKTPASHKVPSTPSSAFLAPLRDTREPMATTLPLEAGSNQKSSKERFVPFAPPQGMAGAILEQVRAFLGIVEVLSSWDATAVWEVLEPPMVCSSDAERMPMPLQMSCPLQFGFVGLGVLLDSHDDADRE